MSHVNTVSAAASRLPALLSAKDLLAVPVRDSGQSVCDGYGEEATAEPDVLAWIRSSHRCAVVQERKEGSQNRNNRSREHLTILGP